MAWQRTVRIRSAVFHRTNKALNIMLPFETARQKAKVKTLIDSGATENFISPLLAKRLGVNTRQLPMPIDLKTVDGSTHQDGQLTQYCWLKITLGQKEETMFFFVATLGQDQMILGHPFLFEFNPKINWRQGTVEGGSMKIQSTWKEHHGHEIFRLQRRAIKAVGYPKKDEAIYIRRTNFAQQWAHKHDDEVKLTLETIPEKYKRHKRVFSEEASKRFPPSRSEDMTIKFHPDAPKVINCKVDPLSAEDRDTILKWLEQEEVLKRIFKGASPITSPTFLIDKRDKGEKRVVMDFREVNKWTIRDNNPLPNIQTALERLHGKTLFSKFDIQWVKKLPQCLAMS